MGLKAMLRPVDVDAMRLLAFAAIALLAAMSLVGCGKAGAPTQTAVSSTATLARFDGRANEICGTLAREQEAIESRSHAPRATGEAVWHEIVAVSRAADNEVRALPRPPMQAGVIDQLVAAYFREARDEEEIASAYGTGDVERIRAAFATFISLARRDAAVARNLGMTACAKAGPE
jgi:hypothetical protein